MNILIPGLQLKHQSCESVFVAFPGFYCSLSYFHHPNSAALLEVLCAALIGVRNDAAETPVTLV